MARQPIQPAASWTNIMPTSAGQVTRRRKATARRGPIMSHRKPVTARMTMLEETARMLPVPMSVFFRFSEVSFFMYIASAGAANIEKKLEKTDIGTGNILAVSSNWVLSCQPRDFTAALQKAATR